MDNSQPRPAARLRRQRGVVLFIALIALVAMSLGGIAIMRSVDTATLIAGNLAFRQSALNGADMGFERAYTWLSANRNVLATTNEGSGYFSALGGSFVVENDASWANAVNAGTDAAGNQISFIIHRVCATANQVVANAKCAAEKTVDAGAAANPEAGDSFAAGGTVYQRAAPIFYRVTARAIGPRNNKVYVQGMISLPQ